jgi:predicted acyltransferase
MSNRATSIDLLRGFALVMMIFSGMIPFGGALPAWMYHAQVPPPLHEFNPNLAGLTWVDLVFPFFLFSMGAAVPFAVPIKLAKQGLTKTLFELLRRSIRLLLFAIIGWNFHPLRLPTLGWWAQIAGVLTYLGLFLSFFTYPNISKRLKQGATVLGVVLIVGIYFWLTFSEKEINPATNDAIIRVLANVYFIGSIIWLATNGIWALRISICVFIMAFYLGSLEKGSWVEQLWSSHDIFNLVSPMLLKYLLIFIPGTIAGDILIVKFIAPRPDDEGEEEEDDGEDYSASQIIADFLPDAPVFVEETTPLPLSYQRNGVFVYSIVAVIATVVTLWAAVNRDMGAGLAINAVLGLVAFVSVFFVGSSLSEEELLTRPIAQEQFIKIQLVLFGFSLLIIGYFLDPFQGGVKKDHATLSYFFLTSGLSTLWVLAFHHFYPALWVSKLFKPFELVGQNALMAYLMAGFLIVPIMNLTHFSDLFIAPSPDKIAAYGLAKAVLITASVVGLTAFLSKKQVFWKI